MYSPLTTMPRRIAPILIQLSRMKTPVNMPAQALETSKVIAFVAPISFATAMLIAGSSHCVKPSRYFVMLQLITTSSSSALQSVRARQS